MNIEDLYMSERTTKILFRNRIKTTEDLEKITEEQVIKFRNLGRKSFEELLLKMKEYGICFKVD